MEANDPDLGDKFGDFGDKIKSICQLYYPQEESRPHLSNTLHQRRNNANYINAGPTSNEPSNKTARMGPVPPDHPSTPPYGIANDRVPMATQRLTKTGQFSLVASCCGGNMTRSKIIQELTQSCSAVLFLER
ncbi:hypothetical protein AVEN_116053-1 [Araneus ventricosus]|uniref:Uncharacterized protein n=1 Tax=Araneus ventricosus TaxID=182803 RepID=A0A4Y2P7B6_ARAVE|nr:hypothetical protein AVEN_116053-1 [Araneus ventricosus]